MASLLSYNTLKYLLLRFCGLLLHTDMYIYEYTYLYRYLSVYLYTYPYLFFRAEYDLDFTKHTWGITDFEHILVTRLFKTEALHFILANTSHVLLKQTNKTKTKP